MSKELETSWRNAFDFVQKFYFEISYLIKEVEGQLAKEPEKFVICRKTGYGVTSYTSTQLDARQVQCWIPATLMVAFVPEDCTKPHQGVTITPIKDSLRPPPAPRRSPLDRHGAPSHPQRHSRPRSEQAEGHEQI